MRVLVTGATGFVGAALVGALRERGDAVVALGRSTQRIRARLGTAVAPYSFDPAQGPAPAAAFAGVDAIVHLAGESVVGRWTAEKKRRIRDSRVAGTQRLIEGLLASGVRPASLVVASAIGYYGHDGSRGDEELDETSPPGHDFLAQTCVDWERAALGASEAGCSPCWLRIGLVLHPSGGALGSMLPAARWGLSGPLGSGRQWWSWIDREDLVRLILHAIDHRWTGAFDATSPQPVRQRTFARTLGRVLRRPAFVPVPAWTLRLALGEFAVELLGSKRVLPRRTEAEGFRFRRPHLEDALRAHFDPKRASDPNP